MSRISASKSIARIAKAQGALTTLDRPSLWAAGTWDKLPPFHDLTERGPGDTQLERGPAPTPNEENDMWLRLTYTYITNTYITEQQIAVNTTAVKRIVDATDRDGSHVGCKIVFEDGETIAVKESYTKVMAMIEGTIEGQKDKFKGAIRG